MKDKTSDKFWGFGLKRTSFIVKNSLEKELRDAKIDITAEQMAILFKLKNTNGLSQGELAEITIKDITTITRQLDILVKKEFAKRVNDDFDRRIVRAYITEMGKEAINKTKPIILKLKKQAFEGISNEDANITIETLKKVRNNLSK